MDTMTTQADPLRHAHTYSAVSQVTWRFIAGYRIMRMGFYSVGSMVRILLFHDIHVLAFFFQCPCSTGVTVVKHLSVMSWCKEQVKKDACAPKAKMKWSLHAHASAISTSDRRKQYHVKCPLQCAEQASRCKTQWNYGHPVWQQQAMKRPLQCAKKPLRHKRLWRSNSARLQKLTAPHLSDSSWFIMAICYSLIS